MPVPSNTTYIPKSTDQCVVVTGATGDLGSHLVAYFAALPHVRSIVCLNRYNSREATLRQREALTSRGLSLGLDALSKLKVFETDTSKPMLGLPSSAYEHLADNVTHIVHNAWPLSLTRPVKGFESQFKVMRNLISLASEAASKRLQGPKIAFQFISSLTTVAYFPIWSGNARVPEERVTVESVLPIGYADAKLVCERMLEETLEKQPERFRPMTVRIGQIAGSNITGQWKTNGVLAFMVKSAQTLRAIPNFQGDLSWCPVDDTAVALGELLVSNVQPYPIYHIENPSRQPWREMILVLAAALDIPRSNIIPFQEWVQRVRQFPGSMEADNPSGRNVEFFDQNFVLLACGGMILDTAKSTEHSRTLRARGPISDDLVRKYIRSWKEMGFLYKD